MQHNSLFERDRFDVGMNTLLKVKLIPQDYEPVYSQSSPTPTNLRDDLLVELSLMHKHGNITSLPHCKFFFTKLCIVLLFLPPQLPNYFSKIKQTFFNLILGNRGKEESSIFPPSLQSMAISHSKFFSIFPPRLQSMTISNSRFFSIFPP